MLTLRHKANVLDPWTRELSESCTILKDSHSFWHKVVQPRRFHRREKNPRSCRNANDLHLLNIGKIIVMEWSGERTYISLKTRKFPTKQGLFWKAQPITSSKQFSKKKKRWKNVHVCRRTDKINENSVRNAIGSDRSLRPARHAKVQCLHGKNMISQEVYCSTCYGVHERGLACWWRHGNIFLI